MRNSRSLFGAAVVALLVSACAGSPVSLTAQRGSSILVPVGPYDWYANEVIAGFGRPPQPGAAGGNNAAWIDAQRGELEFYVDDGVGAGEIFALRATSASMPSLASPYGRQTGAPNVSTSELLALLDIPADAPLGQQTLRYRNKQTPAVSTALGSIWVLPREVLLCEAPSCGAPAGTPVATGQPSPFVVAGGYNITGVVKRTVPDPQLIIPLPANAHAVELEVMFPIGLATVVDAFEYRTDRAADLAWVSVSSCTAPFPMCIGNYRVKAVAVDDDGIDNLALVFQLSGSTPVNLAANPAQVRVYTLIARDRFGNPIPAFPEFPAQIDRTTFYVQ